MTNDLKISYQGSFIKNLAKLKKPKACRIHLGKDTIIFDFYENLMIHYLKIIKLKMHFRAKKQRLCEIFNGETVFA